MALHVSYEGIGEVLRTTFSMGPGSGPYQALKRSLATAQAEYRHAWDYGTKEEAEQCFTQVVSRAAKLRALDLCHETGKTLSHEKLEFVIRQVAAGKDWGRELRLPNKG